MFSLASVHRGETAPQPLAAGVKVTPAEVDTQWCGKIKSVSAKEVIYREGDQSGHVHFIKRGLVKLVSYLPNGKARIVRLQRSGALIGRESLLDQPYEHTAFAISRVVELESCSIRQIRNGLYAEPEAVSQMLWQWQVDLLQADRWIAEFSTGCIRQRVARLLAYLAETEDGLANGYVELLTVQEISEILGVTQESVSRVLASFKRTGILERQDHYKDLFRINTEKLCALDDKE